MTKDRFLSLIISFHIERKKRLRIWVQYLWKRITFRMAVSLYSLCSWCNCHRWATLLIKMKKIFCWNILSMSFLNLSLEIDHSIIWSRLIYIDDRVERSIHLLFHSPIFLISSKECIELILKWNLTSKWSTTTRISQCSLFESKTKDIFFQWSFDKRYWDYSRLLLLLLLLYLIKI